MWFFRLIAGGISIFAVTQLPFNTYVSIILLLSVSHTFLGAYYSKGRLHKVYSSGNRQKMTIFLLGIITCACIYYDSFEMYYLILFHHVLNEIYTSIKHDDEYEKNQALFFTFIAFETLVFMTCSPVELQRTFTLVDLDMLFVFQTLLFLALIVLAQLGKAKKSFIAFILFGMMFSSYSYFIKVLDIDFLILYHFIFWLIFPAVKMWASKSNGVNQYWIQTALIMLVCLPFTLLFPSNLSLSVENMSYITRVLAYYHIFSTIAVSSSNPGFVRNFFQKTNIQLRGISEKESSQSTS